MLAENLFYPPLFPRIINGTNIPPLAQRDTELSQSSKWIEEKFGNIHDEAQMAIPGPIRRWSIEQRRRAWEHAPTPEKRALVERKIKHTYNVNAKSYRLAGKTPQFNWNIQQVMVNADLHDMGRFPQAIHFATFADGDSFNHAVMGSKMIENARLPFEHFGCNEGLTLDAVGYHSDRTCPDNLYFHLLRDADKIIIAGEYIEDIEGAIAAGTMRHSALDPEALEYFISGQSIPTKVALQSPANRLLQRIGWKDNLRFHAAKADYIESGIPRRLIGLLEQVTCTAHENIGEMVADWQEQVMWEK